jgi:hypothetical protein
MPRAPRPETHTNPYSSLRSDVQQGRQRKWIFTFLNRHPQSLAVKRASQVAKEAFGWACYYLLTASDSDSRRLLTCLRSMARMFPSYRKALGVSAPGTPGRRSGSHSVEYVMESVICAFALDLCGVTPKRVRLAAGRKDVRWVNARVQCGRDALRQHPDARLEFERIIAEDSDVQRKERVLRQVRTFPKEKRSRSKLPKPPTR